MIKETLFLTTILSLIVLTGCTNSKQKADREAVLIHKIDSLEQQLSLLTTEKQASPKEERNIDLKGQYSVSQKSVTKLHYIELDNIITPGWVDPDSYSIVNFLNEGQEWKIEGHRKKGLIIMTGTNSTGTKRINGSIEFDINSADTLFVHMTIRNNINSTEDLNQIIDEKWIKADTTVYSK